MVLLFRYEDISPDLFFWPLKPLKEPTASKKSEDYHKCENSKKKLKKKLKKKILGTVRIPNQPFFDPL